MLSLALQALNDSGLGAAVIGGGIDDELKQPIFGLGLKGVDPANVDKGGMWMEGEEKRGAVGSVSLPAGIGGAGSGEVRRDERDALIRGLVR